jgi:hypothetical protein
MKRLLVYFKSSLLPKIIYKCTKHYNYLQMYKTLQLFTNVQNITTIYKRTKHYNYLQRYKTLQLSTNVQNITTIYKTIYIYTFH